MANEVSTTPSAFRHVWFHTTEVKKEICSSDWNPKRNKNSIYGTAIYLSRNKWDLEDLWSGIFGPASSIDPEILKDALKDPNMFVCVLALQPDEVQSYFPTEHAPKGNTQYHLIEYLNMNVPEDESESQTVRRSNSIDNPSTCLRVSRDAGPEDSKQNEKIAAYFLSRGIKAIRFLERDKEVLAVFDPNGIRVLPETTNFGIHPFPEILAGDWGLPIF